jgi:outer membrane receptor for ferrienterochelin and colicins
MRVLFAISALTFCLLARFPISVLAQDRGSSGDSQGSASARSDNKGAPKAKELDDMSLEELSNVQVYSASKHAQSTSEAPASVTVITRDEIQRYGYRTLADILRSVRGLYITYDRIYRYVGVRGFGRPSDFNTRVLLLVDGHRINDNLYDQAMIGTEFWVDIDLIERVEVIRGPSSSLYGANAFFGIINVITRKPEDVKNLEFSFEPASLGTYKGRATYGNDFHGVETLLSASFYNRLGPMSLDTFTNAPTYGDTDDSRDIFVSLSHDGFTLQAVSGYRDKGTGASTGTASFTDSRLHSIDQHHYIDLTYKHSFSHNWNLLNRSYYDRYAFKGAFLSFSAASSLVVSYGIGRWWGDEVQVNHTFFKKHEVTFGTELRDNVKQYQASYTINPSTVFPPDERTSQDWAFYAQDAYTIVRPLTLSAGIRFDKYGSFNWTANPRVALIYHPVEKSVFKVLYGSAFRPPNAFETVGVAPIQPPLFPETIKSVEGIWEQGLSQRYRATVDVFRNNISNLITSDANLVFSNLDNVRSTGAEVELEGRFSGGLMGKVSYGYTQAKDGQTQQILSNSPAHLVKLNLSVPLFKKFLYASTAAQYESSRTTSVGNRLGGFPVFDFSIFTPERHHLELSVSVYNLLDKSYSLPTANGTGALQQDGRTVLGKITWRFGERVRAAHQANSQVSTNDKESADEARLISN